MPAGRPLKFKSVKELQDKINKYFESCYITYTDSETGLETSKNIRPLTITGLALDLETDRITLLEYGNKEEYANTIKEAKLTIHNFAEESLFTNRNVAGVIFNMKNNWNWTDKQEVESTNTNHNLNQDISNMTEEQIKAEIEALK